MAKNNSLYVRLRCSVVVQGPGDSSTAFDALSVVEWPRAEVERMVQHGVADLLTDADVAETKASGRGVRRNPRASAYQTLFTVRTSARKSVL